MQEFTPRPDTSRDLRDALGRFATGVTVVTARSAAGPVGITANSFTSLSLDPPLVLWCPARRSTRFAAFVEAPGYSIHVLSADQRALALRFARSANDFSDQDGSTSPEGNPVLAGCLARFDCVAHAAHEGGDHAILVGEVRRVITRAGTPLIFWGGRYGDFLHHED
jgi:flavin reductase (DIM6/NTAB) family NADH-FMN oxidoreductase RutF